MRTNDPVESKGEMESYPEVGYYKFLYINQTNWEESIRREIIDCKFIDEQTLALIFTFNLYIPSMNFLQAFKLIFNFKVNGLIVMEYDVTQVNLKLFGSDLQNLYAALIFAVGSILLMFSIFDIRAQKKKYLEDKLEMEEMTNKKKKQ